MLILFWPSAAARSARLRYGPEQKSPELFRHQFTERSLHELACVSCYGVERIRLVGRDEPLHLVVIAGFGEEPILLLTNALEGARDSQSLWWIAQIYLTRWKMEETFRFLKQSYNLEDIRVMKYQRLKNLVVLVMAAAYFAATFLGQKRKLRIVCEKLLILSQRFFGIPPFRFYALADGIKKILSQTTLSPPEKRLPSSQLELLFGWERQKF
jgi:hypothetical protein